MIDRLDQIFVLLKHWILGYLPGGWQTAVGVLLSVVCIIGLYPALFALAMVLERKGAGAHAEPATGRIAWGRSGFCSRSRTASSR